MTKYNIYVSTPVTTPAFPLNYFPIALGKFHVHMYIHMYMNSVSSFFLIFLVIQ